MMAKHSLRPRHFVKINGVNTSVANEKRLSGFVRDCKYKHTRVLINQGYSVVSNTTFWKIPFFNTSSCPFASIINRLREYLQRSRSPWLRFREVASNQILRGPDGKRKMIVLPVGQINEPLTGYTTSLLPSSSLICLVLEPLRGCLS